MPRYSVPLAVTFVVRVEVEAASPAQALERAKGLARPADFLLGKHPDRVVLTSPRPDVTKVYRVDPDELA